MKPENRYTQVMTIVMLCSFYLYAGAAVAAVFLLFGLGQIDENAQGAWIFRPLLIPGVLLIWPLVIWRLVILWRGEQKLDRHQMPRIRQERAQLAFVVVIPLIILVAVLVRQDPSTLPAPVMIEAAK
jgi:DMSO reductase anchor subunit